MRRELSAALLLKDIKVAQEFSELFRKVGVVPHYYETLEDYWFGVMSDIPTISIIDINLMSHGRMALKNHPNIISENLPVAFYGDIKHPFAHSSFEIFNHGFINEKASLEGQLKSVLARLNKYFELNLEIDDLRSEQKRVEDHNHSLLKENNIQKAKAGHQKSLGLLFSEIKDQCEGLDFFNALSCIFGSWKSLESFTILEMSQSGDKLVSPPSRSLKFKKIPSLWLGESSYRGISRYAENMAGQVVIDLLGLDVITLRIFGKEKNPDCLVFLKVEEELIKEFDWRSFEELLSGLNSQVKYKRMALKGEQANWLSPWELMGELDQHFLGYSKNDINILNVNLRDLTKIIRSRSQFSFYWKDFFNDFIGRLRKVSPCDFQVCSFDLDNVTFVIDRSESELFFKTLKGFTRNFDFWRHFEQVDDVIGMPIEPMVNMIPLSSEAYLKFVENSELGYEAFNRVSLDSELNQLENKQKIFDSENIDSDDDFMIPDIRRPLYEV